MDASVPVICVWCDSVVIDFRGFPSLATEPVLFAAMALEPNRAEVTGAVSFLPLIEAGKVQRFFLFFPSLIAPLSVCSISDSSVADVFEWIDPLGDFKGFKAGLLPGVLFGCDT